MPTCGVVAGTQLYVHPKCLRRWQETVRSTQRRAFDGATLRSSTPLMFGGAYGRLLRCPMNRIALRRDVRLHRPQTPAEACISLHMRTCWGLPAISNLVWP